MAYCELCDCEQQERMSEYHHFLDAGQFQRAREAILAPLSRRVKHEHSDAFTLAIFQRFASVATLKICCCCESPLTEQERGVAIEAIAEERAKPPWIILTNQQKQDLVYRGIDPNEAFRLIEPIGYSELMQPDTLSGEFVEE